MELIPKNYKIYNKLNYMRKLKNKRRQKQIKRKISMLIYFCAEYFVKQILILIKIIIIFIFLFILFINITKRIPETNNGQTQLITKSKIKIALCAISKNENRYIKYFLENYKNLGYNHIYLYDNNDIGDEPIIALQIVKDLIKEDFLTVIEYRNKTGLFQTDSYHDCYRKYNSKYDWISFFDLDEYLILANNQSIQDFFDNQRFNNCESVQFNWKVFNDNEQLDFEDKSPIERFPVETSYTYEQQHIKSTIRGGLDYNRMIEIGSPHTVYRNVKACTSSGKPNNNRFFSLPVDYENGALNHYVTKTIKEYFLKRIKTKAEADNLENISQSNKNYWFDYFFKINKKTKEKVDIFNKLFHTNFQ